MDRRAQLVFDGTSQVLECYPPEAYLGVPSSATISVWRGDAGNDATPDVSAQSATIDSVDVSLSAASGYSQTNRRTITVTSTASLVAGRRYRLVEYVTRASSVEAHCEIITIKRIVSGAVAELEHDLAYDYTVTSPNIARVMGIRATYTIADAFCAEDAHINDEAYPWRALWTYTLGGVTRRHWTYFDLARAPRQTSVTADDLYAVWPQLRYMEDVDAAGTQYRALIDEAYERVRYDLDMAGVPAHQVVEGQDRLVVFATMSLLADVGRHPPERDGGEWARERWAIYKRYLERAVASGRLKTSQGVDGSITPTVRPFMLRS